MVAMELRNSLLDALAVAAHQPISVKDARLTQTVGFALGFGEQFIDDARKHIVEATREGIDREIDGFVEFLGRPDLGSSRGRGRAGKGLVSYCLSVPQRTLFAN